ncbi:hypothetical protein pb186bvf_000602 [Paramecium bursaria]
MNNYQIICLFVSSAFSLSLTITFAVNIANSLSFVLLIINSLIAFMLSLIFLMSMLQKQYMNLITMLILYLQTVLLIMVNGFYLTSSCSGQISLSLILGGQLYQMVLKDSHFQQRTHMKIVYFVSSSVLALFYIGFTNLVIAPKLENVESGIFIILVIILQIKTSVDLDREDSKSTDALHFKEKPQDHNKIVFSQYFDHPKSRAELLSQRDLGFNKIVISKSIKIDQSLLYESLEFFNEGLVILQESDYQKRQLPFDITYMNQANKALFGVKDSVEMIEYLEQLKNLQVSLQDSDEIMEKRRDSKNSREQQFNKMARSINMVRMLEVSTVKQFDQVMVEDKISTVSMTELIMRLKRQGSSQQVFMRCFLNTDNLERMLEFVVKYEPKDKFVIIISRDVTHRQKIKYLKEYDLQKSKFLSFVSHEYRTPLNSIITMLETVLPTTVGEQKQWLQTALENTQYILNLSNDLLDLAQIKSGKFKMQQTKINLEELCKECLNMFTLSAYIKNIELECCYDEESPKVILADKNRIKQILVNLLSNAFKFTKNGKIKILVSQKNQNVLRVGVKDNGIGISESDQKLLFKAFAKVNSEESSKLNNTGVGLGLMICNQIAQQLGPNSQGIQIESNKGQGSYFYFEFDLIYHLTQKPSSIKLREVKIIDQQEYYQPPTEQKITTEINCKCNRILVVDDEQFNLTVFKLKLNKMGVEDVDYAQSGQEAIEKVENSRCGIPCYAYKLIFMDLMMPKMSGLQTASQIIKQKPNQVIIACSGHSEQSEKKECSLAGIKDYLEKPIKDDNLKTILQTYL